MVRIAGDFASLVALTNHYHPSNGESCPATLFYVGGGVMPKVLSVEVKRIGDTDDDDKNARTRLRELCEMIQQATNYVWDEWRAWHHANGSRQKLIKWYADIQAWYKADENERGEKPEMKVHDLMFSPTKGKNKGTPRPDNQAVPSVLQNRLYGGVATGWPDLHLRTVVLTMNRMTIGSRKAAHGSLPGWVAILLNHEAIPSFTNPLPLNFDTGNARLTLPETTDSHHKLVLSLAREEVEGKTTKASVKFVCHIWDRGKQMAGRRIVLSKIARGEYQMKGSQLCFSRGKIFANITYDVVESPSVPKTGCAFLMASRHQPLVLKLLGRTGGTVYGNTKGQFMSLPRAQLKWIGGDGRLVAEKRRELMHQRMSRKMSYRLAPTANSRGHGRHRAFDKVSLLSRRWRDFTTTMSRNMAMAVAKECLRHGIGVLYIGRPKKDSRFLSRAGNDSRYDETSWAWHVLWKMLNDKCSEHGVQVIMQPEKPPYVQPDGKQTRGKKQKSVAKSTPKKPARVG